jgi:amino-acid N-acetyltransferase
VAEGHQKRGIGRMLVAALIEEGQRMRVPHIMALTYQVDFFKKQGFEVTSKDRFPRKIWRECLECPKLEECDETAMYLAIDLSCFPDS